MSKKAQGKMVEQQAPYSGRETHTMNEAPSPQLQDLLNQLARSVEEFRTRDHPLPDRCYREAGVKFLLCMVSRDSILSFSGDPSD